jgi:broad specificity phosphatase PhoE
VAQELSAIDLAAVVSSGLERTEHMAACLRARGGLPRVDDPALHELERGEWTGSTPLELEARWPGAWAAWFATPATSRPPGGESLEDLLRRVRPRVEHWARAHPGRSVALVTHGWVVRVLVCHVLGAPLALAPRLDVRTADVSVIHWPAVGHSHAPALEGFALDSSVVRVALGSSPRTGTR